jgi:hypothetical protein
LSFHQQNVLSVTSASLWLVLNYGIPCQQIYVMPQMCNVLKNYWKLTSFLKSRPYDALFCIFLSYLYYSASFLKMFHVFK